MRGLRALLLGLTLLAGAVIAPSAPAQPTEVGPAGPADTGGEVDLKVLQFGVGGQARPGSWVGVQVQVTDQGTTTREIVLELSMPDVGGDTALYQTTLALGGEKKTAWLYARLPFTIEQGYKYKVSAYTVGEPAADQRAAGVVHTARRIGVNVFEVPSQALVSRHRGMFAVVGRSPAGLERYEITVGQGADWPAIANEAVTLAGNITAATLPDRWMGLAQFETLVWTGAGPELEPTDIGDDRAKAVREWVQRGGHLIIILPPVGQAWTNPTQPLYDIMPRVKVSRNETADLNPYRPILTDNAQIGLPTKAVVQTFERLPETKEAEATTILAGPDQKPIVVRRTVGAGAVTLIGLDVAGRTLSSLGANKADVFWHRILGRRGILLTNPEINEEIRTTKTYKNLTDRAWRQFDGDIATLVNKTGHAAAGVLLAFSIFGLYWLFAGPLGFWLLRKRSYTQHAWVGFAVAGLLFTALAWGGATLLRPGALDAQHLTLIDHVYGQDTQRAKMWVSALLPKYGAMRVAVEGDKTGAMTNAIAPWDPPPADNGAPSTSTFPNAHGYGINSRAPDSILAPSRATVKTFTVDWAGGPIWKMPMPVNADGTTPGTAGAALRITGEGTSLALQGALKHDLPAALHDVYIIVVRSQMEITNNRKASRALYAQYIWQQRQEWKPGEVWDFNDPAEGVAANPTPAWQTRDLLNDIVGPAPDDGMGYYPTMPRSRTGRGGAAAPAVPTYGKPSDRLAALSLFGVLSPPDPNSTTRPVLAVRSEAHGMDVSRWFTQPCVIVIGHIENASSPVPLTLNGEPLGTMGHTVVRWIYPLPQSPPRVPLPN